MALTTIDPQARDPAAVRAMFGRIARRYDLANHLLSGGMDFWWRHRAAAIVQQWQPARLLDLATGSGDLALALQRRLPDAEITAADFSPEMLERARAKGVRHTVVADALQLPFADGAFGCVTVAFGLRNMRDWDAAVREMARILQPGGHMLVLDFSMPGPPWRSPYAWYLRRVLPHLAALITQERNAYEYLGVTIENFPQGAAMLQLIERNGFAGAVATRLTWGVATIYTARRG